MNIKSLKKRTREALGISLPIMVEHIFITLMGVVSTIMVSRIGEYAVSAVGMVDSLSIIMISLFSAMTTGSTIVIAQYTGKKDTENANEAAVQSIVMSVVFSVAVLLLIFIFRYPIVSFLFGRASEDVLAAAHQYLLITIFSYPILAVMQTCFGIIRGAGNTSTPMLITLLINVFNVVLTYLLVYGIHIDANILGLSLNIHTRTFGVSGAAAGLLAARLIGALLGIYYLLKKSKTVHIKGLIKFKLNMQMQKIILNIGVPTSVESVLFNAGKLITQTLIVAMGTSAIAANSIAGSIAGLINVPGSALGTGVMIIIGHRIGRGESDDIKKTSIFFVGLSMVIMLVICIAFALSIDLIIPIYNPSAETTVYLKQLLYILLLATPIFWPASFALPSALRATGDVRVTMAISVVSMWTFRIGFGYLLGVVFSFGVAGIWVAMIIDWVVRSIFFSLRLLSGKWKKAAL